jgi:hypothetical protein
MRKLLLFFAGLIIMTELSAQSIDVTSNILSPETIQTLKLKTQSLISFVLTDSLFNNVRYVENHYDAILHYIDEVNIKKGKNKWFHKNRQESVDNIQHQISENDYKFALIQMKDTSSLVLVDSLTTKVLINDKLLVDEPVILIEKPLFSSNFQQAFIRTWIDFKGGCVGYEFDYFFENRNWKKTSIKIIVRC